MELHPDKVGKSFSLLWSSNSCVWACGSVCSRPCKYLLDNLEWYCGVCRICSLFCHPHQLSAPFVQSAVLYSFLRTWTEYHQFGAWYNLKQKNITWEIVADSLLSKLTNSNSVVEDPSETYCRWVHFLKATVIWTTNSNGYGWICIALTSADLKQGARDPLLADAYPLAMSLPGSPFFSRVDPASEASSTSLFSSLHKLNTFSKHVLKFWYNSDLIVMKIVWMLAESISCFPLNFKSIV